MSVEKRLLNWIGSLDRLIGDRETQIAERREANKETVALRSDLEALIAYIGRDDMSEAARRALEECLRWNPHAVK